MDGAVLLAAVGLAVLTALLFGLAPALQLARVRLEAVQGGGTRALADRRGRGFRRAVVVAELAVSALLLVAAGLLGRTLAELQRVELGFGAEQVLTGRLTVPAAVRSAPEEVIAFYRETVARLADQSGVAAAGAVRVLPLAATIGDWSITVEGRPAAPGENPNGDFQIVTPGYLEAMGLDVVEGRSLRQGDHEDAPLVALVNTTMAQRYWGGAALGRRFHLGTADQRWITVVGVVAGVRHNAVLEEPRAEMYIPHAQFAAAGGYAARGMSLVMRTEGRPQDFAGAMRAAVRETDAEVPLADVRPLAAVVADAYAAPRFSAVLMGLFAAFAVALSAVGAYGLIALSVAERRREIGLRMALGARAAQVVGMVAWEGMLLGAAGIALGVGGAFLLAELAAAHVYGVSPRDPVTFGTVALGLTLVTLLACVVPAWRAARMEVVGALRGE